MSQQPGSHLRYNSLMRPSFYHHLHPPTIPAAQARYRYTLGAGGLAVFLALVLLLTGMLETFYYIPSSQEAAHSVQNLTFQVPLGWLVRNLHYWAAQLLVAAVAVHLLRVVFTGAYLPSRRLNYLLGLVLLVVCLFLDFTGYVLRWDQGVHWALVTGTNLIKSIPAVGPAIYRWVVGGGQVGAATLIRFYAWHLFGLALPGAVIGVWHLFRVRRDGGIAVPPPQARKDARRITRFELVRREGLAMLWATAVLLALALLIPAPLAPPIEAGSTGISDTQAPWFFLWVQQLLRLGSPFVFGILIPLGVLALMASIPYWLRRPALAELGAWFPAGGRSAQVVVGILALAMLLLTALGRLR